MSGDQQLTVDLDLGGGVDQVVKASAPDCRTRCRPPPRQPTTWLADEAPPPLAMHGRDAGMLADTPRRCRRHRSRHGSEGRGSSASRRLPRTNPFDRVPIDRLGAPVRRSGRRRTASVSNAKFRAHARATSVKRWQRSWLNSQVPWGVGALSGSVISRLPSARGRAQLLGFRLEQIVQAVLGEVDAGREPHILLLHVLQDAASARPSRGRADR